MIQRHFTFPKFETGQTLTSNALNSSFGYIEEQNRMTRSNLIGTGILKGLNYSFNSIQKILTIHPGIAVTSDGFFIHITNPKIYKCCTTSEYTTIKEYSPLEDKVSSSKEFNYFRNKICFSFYENKSDAENNGVIKTMDLPDSIEDYLVALVIDFPQTSKITCNQVTCNANHIQTKIDFRPVLVLKKDFPNPYRQLNPILEKCSLFKLNGFDTMLNIKVIAKKTRNLYCENSKKICEALNTIESVFSEDWKKIMIDYKDIINQLHRCNENIKKWATVKDSIEIPQYFLMFLEDMCTAINELIDFYNSFANKYPYIRTSQNLIDRIIFIGQNNYKNKTELDYIYRFEPVIPEISFSNDCKILETLLHRIYEMSFAFIAHNYDAKHSPISFIWKKENSLLGENPIPFYYNEKKLTPFWNAYTPNINYIDDGKRKSYNDILMFQNCYGKNVWKVWGKLKKYLISNNISSVKINAICVGKRKLSNKYNDSLIKIFDTYKEQISRNLENLIRSNPIKLSKVLGFTHAKRNRRNVIQSKQKVLERFNSTILSAISKANASEELTLNEIKYLTNRLNPISTKNMIEFYNQIIKIINPNNAEKISPEEEKKMFSYCDFASLFALRSYINLGYNENLTNCIYNEGIKGNSTIYLLYYQSGKKEKKSNKNDINNYNHHKYRFLFAIYKNN